MVPNESSTLGQNRYSILGVEGSTPVVRRALASEDSMQYWSSDDNADKESEGPEEAAQPSAGRQIPETPTPVGKSRPPDAALPPLSGSAIDETPRTRKRQRVNSDGDAGRVDDEYLNPTKGGEERGPGETAHEHPPPYNADDEAASPLVKATLAQIVHGLAVGPAQAATTQGTDSSKEALLEWLTAQVRAKMRHEDSAAEKAQQNPPRMATEPITGGEASRASDAPMAPKAGEERQRPRGTEMAGGSQEQARRGGSPMSVDGRPLTRFATAPQEFEDAASLTSRDKGKARDDSMREDPVEGIEIERCTLSPRALGLDIDEELDDPSPLDIPLAQPFPAMTPTPAAPTPVPANDDALYTPTHNGKYPKVHLDGPGDRARNLTQDALRRYEAAGQKRCGVEVFGQIKLSSTALCEVAGKLETAILDKTKAGGVILIQPTKPAGSFDPKMVPGTWIVLDLEDEEVGVLADDGAVTTEDISFFVFRDIHEVPDLLFALKGFVQMRDDHAKKEIGAILSRDEHKAEIINLVKQNPDYEGKDPAAVATRLIRSMHVRCQRVKTREHGTIIVAYVYMKSPTRSGGKWEIWRDGLVEEAFNPNVFDHPYQRISTERCRGCHGVDHPTVLCPYLELEGWHGSVRDLGDSPWASASGTPNRGAHNSGRGRGAPANPRNDSYEGYGQGPYQGQRGGYGGRGARGRPYHRR
ncbi:hypothetical protein ACG7TL_008409 [Trametes sanguinea]